MYIIAGVAPSAPPLPLLFQLSIPPSLPPLPPPSPPFLSQIHKVVIALGDYMDLQCHACIGGGNVKEDFRKLEQGQHVVVGTPGRVLDMINRRALSEEGGGENGGERRWLGSNTTNKR